MSDLRVEDKDLETRKREYQEMLKSEVGRATWSLALHKQIGEEAKVQSTMYQEDFE